MPFTNTDLPTPTETKDLIDPATPASQNSSGFQRAHVVGEAFADRTMMTAPNLRTLVAQAGDVLGRWGAALEQTHRETVSHNDNPARGGWPYILERAA